MMIASVLVGGLVVLLIITDLTVTILHPSMRGPVSHYAERLTWVVVRRLARSTGQHRLLTFGGPAAMAADFVAWVMGLWLGFGLIYAPFVPVMGYSLEASSQRSGSLTALYLSGVSLTTVGFGDVVGGTDALRLLTVLEAASGLAVIIAALAYVTAVYPRVSLARTTAMGDGPQRPYGVGCSSLYPPGRLSRRGADAARPDRDPPGSAAIPRSVLFPRGATRGING